MKNLAGRQDCDEWIIQELQRARIDVVRGERTPGEVPYSVTGRLGEFKFHRAWYYWIAEGMVPLAVAEELYADPVGRTDIRVNGNCGCPPPEGCQVKWRDDEGREVWGLKAKAEYEALGPKLREEFAENHSRRRFEADPTRFSGFIDTYHIDSEVGLRIFADAIRNHGLGG